MVRLCQDFSAMAKMIPHHFDGATTSSAEKKIFDFLKNGPETNDWVVLHSLGLVRRGDKPYGEIDFVVIIPGRGVFCMEVKGGRVACHDGEWQTMNRFGQMAKLRRSPFLQAREGMFALRESIYARAAGGIPKEMIMGYAVIFPDVCFSETSPEWEKWQIIDYEKLSEGRIADWILKIAEEQQKLLGLSPSAEPSAATINLMVQLLRPDFEIVVSRSAQLAEADAKILQLTEEQYVALDLLSDNDRCLFEGPAGTGKTVLAMEYARRSANEGGRTVLICYNRLLGDWLGGQTKNPDAGNRFGAASYFRFLRDIIMNSSFRDEFIYEEKCLNASHEYFALYGLYGSLALEESGLQFDRVIVDEAQDLIREDVLSIITMLVKDGLDRGKWAFFADFERQAIFGNAGRSEMITLVRGHCTQFARGRLTLNCRNTRNIGKETSLLSGFTSPPYRMGQIDGPPVDYHFFSDNEGQYMAAGQIISRLLGDQVDPADIVILSKYRFENSFLAGRTFSDFRISDAAFPYDIEEKKPVIRYCTVQSFKGLESRVVVLCDVDDITEESSQSLLYVAMSRARTQLFVLLRERIKANVAERIKNKLQQEWAINHE